MVSRSQEPVDENDEVVNVGDVDDAVDGEGDADADGERDIADEIG